VASGLHRYYVLAVLTLVYTLNFMDQNLLLLLLQPIKVELQLSDTQLGFVSGPAFGILYALMGLPFARWADRGSRTNIAAVAVALWGVMVMACFFVTRMSHLVLARIAAAVGAAGCMPPTYSLVGDYFPRPAERARAMTVYMSASSIASLFSLIVGGWLNELLGWRVALVVIGLPGLAAAVLVRATIKDPTRASGAAASETRAGPSPLLAMVGVWNLGAFRHLALALILLYTMGSGLAPWYAAFIMRTYAIDTGELGVWLGLIFGLGGIAGTLFGGYVAGKWFPRDERAQMRMIAILIIAVVPCLYLFLFAPGKRQALFALVGVMVLFNSFFGPTFALLQRLVPNDLRATTLAAVMLAANLIGMGVGPQVVGALSDALSSVFRGESLRYAMMSFSLLGFWAAHHLWAIGRTVSRDLGTGVAADGLGKAHLVNGASGAQ